MRPSCAVGWGKESSLPISALGSVLRASGRVISFPGLVTSSTTTLTAKTSTLPVSLLNLARSSSVPLKNFRLATSTASSTALTMISGAMCFSRLSCSMDWYSKLAISASPLPNPSRASRAARVGLQLHHQMRLGDFGEGQFHAAVVGIETHRVVGKADDPASEMALVADWRADREVRQLALKPLVVCLFEQLPIQSGGGYLQ